LPVQLDESTISEINQWDAVKTAKDTITDPLAKDLFDDITEHYAGKITCVGKLWYLPVLFESETLSFFERGNEYLEWLNTKPKEFIKIVETALTSIAQSETKATPQVIIDIKTDRAPLPVRALDSRLMGELLVINGVVRAKSELLGRSVSHSYICENCQYLIYSDIYSPGRKPTICPSCKAKNSMRIKDQYDSPVYFFKLEDAEASAVGGINRVVNVVVMFRQAETDKYDELAIGSKVKVTGILERKYKSKDTNDYNYEITSKNIEQVEVKQSLTISDADRTEFQNLALNPDLIEMLAESLAPTISGMELAKTACLLQLVGGNELMIDGLLEERGNLHILLVSSPGLAKTQLAKKVITFLKGSRFTSGKTTSGAGLVCAMMKDEDIGGWYVSAGSVALASGAICAIDELDKVNPEDLSYLNSAMVDLKVPVDKAGLHLVLNTKTSILVCANPKNRVFDAYEPIWKQLGMPKDFLDRFDLIVPIEPPKDEAGMQCIADVMGGKYLPNSKYAKPQLSHDFVTKYIEYARTFTPIPNEEVVKYLKDSFMILSKPKQEQQSDKGRGIGAYLSNRLFTNIMRLAQAVTKLRLSNAITTSDAQTAVTIMIQSLKAQEIITTDNLMDYQKSEAIPTQEKMSLPILTLETIQYLDEQNKEHQWAEYEKIFEMLKLKGKISRETELDEIISDLKRDGMIFEPRNGAYKVLRRR